MSNPLSMFRKHQYIFLVVFGVMLMVAFIVLPPLDDYLRTQRGPGSQGNPVVVRWRGGELRETELERLRTMHRVAVSYLYAVVEETQRREGTPRGVRQGQFGQVLDPGIPSTMSDENLVHTKLLADKGEAMGMVVSDEAIAEFLEQLSDETIQAQEMGAIFKERLGSQFSLQQLLNQLRVELMAQRVRSMAEAGLYVAPYGTVQPVQAWDYFKRLNRRVKIEAVALDVNDFVDRVKAPTDEQLKALYEEGKNRFDYPESPEPGFQKRRKAAFQFVRADFNKFLEEEKAKISITDEEIEQHYEENKDTRYRALDLPDADLEDDAAPVGDTKEPTDPAPAPPKEDPAAKEDAPANQDPAPEPPSDEPLKKESPAEKAPAASPPEPAPTEPAPTEPAPTAPEPAPPTPPPADTQRLRTPREFFVSTEAEENQPPAEAPAAASEAPDAPSAAVEQPAASDPSPAAAPAVELNPANPAADPETTAPKPADAPEAAAATSPKGDANTTPPDAPAASSEPAKDPAPATESAPAATPPDANEPPKVRPLDDKLRQEIRDELIETKARKPAQERLDKAMAEIRSLVTKLGREKRNAMRAANPDADDLEPAGPVDVAEAAGALGLTVGQIPLVDAIEITGGADGSKPGYELGEAFNMQFTPSFQMMRENFTDIAFQDDVRRYSPSMIRGSESGVQFLYWKTDGEEPYVPDFAEARPEVEAAWKRIEARKIAVNEAQNLKEALNKSKEPLAEKFDESKHEVVTPPEFSWMTTGFNPGGAGTPMLSEVEGIENAGPEFMQEVFSLDVGAVGAAMNMPKSKVYIVRVVSDSPPVELLKQLFLTSGDSPEVQYIAYVESISLLRAWYANLESEMDLKWLREPSETT